MGIAFGYCHIASHSRLCDTRKFSNIPTSLLKINWTVEADVFSFFDFGVNEEKERARLPLLEIVVSLI